MYNLSTPAPVALTVFYTTSNTRSLVRAAILAKRHWKRHRKTFMGSKVNGPSFSQAFYTKEKEEENIPIKWTIKHWFLFYYWAKNTNISRKAVWESLYQLPCPLVVKGLQSYPWTMQWLRHNNAWGFQQGYAAKPPLVSCPTVNDSCTWNPYRLVGH